MKTPFKDIELHSDSAAFSPSAETYHMAVDVKTHGLHFPDVKGATNGQTETAWEIAVESFWNAADFAAHRRGYSGVFGEGRSNGWCVPFRQIVDGFLQLHTRNSYPGQGGNHGYPTYPDFHNIGERARFRAFQRDILQLMQEAVMEYEVILSEIVADTADAPTVEIPAQR